jgi:hypothetical protein
MNLSVGFAVWGLIPLWIFCWFCSLGPDTAVDLLLVLQFGA